MTPPLSPPHISPLPAGGRASPPSMLVFAGPNTFDLIPCLFLTSFPPPPPLFWVDLFSARIFPWSSLLDVPGPVLIWMVFLSHCNDAVGGHRLPVPDEEEPGCYLIISIAFVFHSEMLCFLPLQPRVSLRLPLLSSESSSSLVSLPFLASCISTGWLCGDTATSGTPCSCRNTSSMSHS